MLEDSSRFAGCPERGIRRLKIVHEIGQFRRVRCSLDDLFQMHRLAYELLGLIPVDFTKGFYIDVDYPMDGTHLLRLQYKRDESIGSFELDSFSDIMILCHQLVESE